VVDLDIISIFILSMTNLVCLQITGSLSLSLSPFFLRNNRFSVHAIS
jgi:hypothetical protein